MFNGECQVFLLISSFFDSPIFFSSISSAIMDICILPTSERLLVHLVRSLSVRYAVNVGQLHISTLSANRMSMVLETLMMAVTCKCIPIAVVHSASINIFSNEVDACT